MKIIGTAKEIAALVVELQERQTRIGLVDISDSSSNDLIDKYNEARNVGSISV